MRTALIAGFLAVCVVGYQGPYKAAKAQKSQAETEQAPPKPLPPVAQSTEGNEKQDAKQYTGGYLKRAFGPEFLATWVLVIAAIVGLWATVRTLKTIRRQTRSIHHQAVQVKRQTGIFSESAAAAKESADAAKGSADALISSERAWLLVEAMPTGPMKANDKWVWLDGTELTGTEIITHRNIPERVGYIIRNYGRTPGWITSHWSRAVVIASVNDLPVPPNYFTRPASIFMKNLNMVYVPGQERKNEIVIPLGDLAPIAYRKYFLYIYGVINYRDITSKARETRFCFLWHVPTDGDLNPQGFYQEGPDGYNGES